MEEIHKTEYQGSAPYIERVEAVNVFEHSKHSLRYTVYYCDEDVWYGNQSRLYLIDKIVVICFSGNNFVFAGYGKGLSLKPHTFDQDLPIIPLSSMDLQSKCFRKR